MRALPLVWAAALFGCSLPPAAVDEGRQSGSVARQVSIEIDHVDSGERLVIRAAEAEFQGLPGQSEGEMSRVEASFQRRDGSSWARASAEGALVGQDGMITLTDAVLTTAEEEGAATIRAERLDFGGGGLTGRRVHARFAPPEGESL